MSGQYQKASFLLSVADIKQLPPDTGIEIAIVGRSNAGKSSVLNRLTNNKHLARVSKTPGRTRLLNLFEIAPGKRLMDLPGYGFAKAPLAEKERWERCIHAYFANRESLKGCLLIMDSRHPLQPLDWQLLDFCRQRNLSVHLLLNKIDKLTHQEKLLLMKKIEKNLLASAEPITFQVFSATKGIGLKELQQVLNQWYRV